MLSDDILRSCLHPYHLDPSQVQFIGFSQNHVYRTTDRTRIIRISVDRHTTPDDIAAEFRWIDILRSHGVRACAGIPSPAGNVCETVTHDDARYVVSSVAHASGQPVPRGEIYEALCTALGRITGQMHAVARGTVAQTMHLARRQWSESRLLREDVAACRDRLEPGFADCLESMVASLDAAPKHRDTFGLIHADISFGNCHLDADGQLSIFDFDNCEFGYHLQDIATALYDSIYLRLLNRVWAEELPARIDTMFNAFMTGYRESRPNFDLDGSALLQFFLLREGVIAVHYHRILDFTRLTDTQRAGIREMQQNLIAGTHPAAGKWARRGSH